MRILVTGSRGTLGSRLMPALSAAGYEVFGCDLAHSAEDRYIRADVADYQQLQRAFVRAAPHVVIHLAAEFGRVNGEEYTQQLWRTNCIGTRNVIDMCLVWKAHLVFASSSEAYGDLPNGENLPLEEDDLKILAPRFFNEYALTKWANEKQVEIASKRGLRATIMRLFNIYGPGEHYTPYRSVVCRFIWQMLNGKTVRVSDGHRQLLYVDDWVDFVLRAVEKKPVDVFNVAGKEEVTMELLAHMAGGIIAPRWNPPQVSYKETRTVSRKRCSTEKAKNILGWEPVTPLDEGLRKTVEWMRCQLMSSCVPVPTSTETLSDGISTMPSSTAG